MTEEKQKIKSERESILPVVTSFFLSGLLCCFLSLSSLISHCLRHWGEAAAYSATSLLSPLQQAGKNPDDHFPHLCSLHPSCQPIPWCLAIHSSRLPRPPQSVLICCLVALTVFLRRITLSGCVRLVTGGEEQHQRATVCLRARAVSPASSPYLIASGRKRCQNQLSIVGNLVNWSAA